MRNVALKPSLFITFSSCFLVQLSPCGPNTWTKVWVDTVLEEYYTKIFLRENSSNIYREDQKPQDKIPI